MFKRKRRAALAAIAMVIGLVALLTTRPFHAAADNGTYLIYTGGVFGRLDPCG